MNRLIAIIVTYNRSELLVQCIEALLLQSYKEFDILIVDNNSTDDTFDRISDYISDKKIIYENTGANLGGAGGFNYGIRYAYELGYDYFWLMDGDTISSPSALQELLRGANEKNEEFGYLVSKALWTDGSLCKMNIPHPVDKGILIKENTSDTVQINRATFVSFLVPRFSHL